MAKMGEHPRQVPSNFAPAMPAGRCKVVRVDRWAGRGNGSRGAHKPKMGSLRYRNNNLPHNYRRFFKNLSISLTTWSAAFRETANAMWLQSSSTAASRSPLNP